MICYYHAHSRCPLKAGCDEFHLDAVPEVLVCVSCLSIHMHQLSPQQRLSPKIQTLQWHERGLGSSKGDLSHCETSQVSLDFPFLGVRKYRWWLSDFDLQFLKFQWPKMRFKPCNSQINSENGIWACLKFFYHHFYPNKFHLRAWKIPYAL